jgi:hypothetical protein
LCEGLEWNAESRQRGGHRRRCRSKSLQSMHLRSDCELTARTGVPVKADAICSPAALTCEVQQSTRLRLCEFESIIWARCVSSRSCLRLCEFESIIWARICPNQSAGPRCVRIMECGTPRSFVSFGDFWSSDSAPMSSLIDYAPMSSLIATPSLCSSSTLTFPSHFEVQCVLCR